ncbi:hypothetical protein MPLB_2410008 [Mesorhizobium sp. ORS 3324]|nr:hypothetical protein MPLB_2410008 [Mesorhizobium sp. ORS 3324]
MQEAEFETRASGECSGTRSTGAAELRLWSDLGAHWAQSQFSVKHQSRNAIAFADR